VIDDSELRDLDAFAIHDAEAHRLDGFFATLAGDDWLRDTRCAGWRRRELLAHLAASERYNHATLDGTVPALMEEAGKHGVSGMDSFNAWGVSEREGRSTEELLQEWRRADTDTRHRLRELGWDGALQTFVGPYPAGRQALHLAMEYAVHADDMGVPVADGERRLRGTWQARLARFTLREYGREVEVESDGAGNNVLRAGGVEVTIDDEGLIDACSARLPEAAPLPQQFRDLLKVFA
jgi:uncharacterized protein (TIGR03083 family)